MCDCTTVAMNPTMLSGAVGTQVIMGGTGYQAGYFYVWRSVGAPVLFVLQVNKLVREIEVSHWGNIYVEEVYEIVSSNPAVDTTHFCFVLSVDCFT